MRGLISQLQTGIIVNRRQWVTSCILLSNAVLNQFALHTRLSKDCDFAVVAMRVFQVLLTSFIARNARLNYSTSGDIIPFTRLMQYGIIEVKSN